MIGSCDCCDRKNVPISFSEADANNSGSDVNACFICRGYDDPDPYGELNHFHPDKNLPGCMLPDGGDCCAGHAAVVEDWHKQRREIERLRDELKKATNR